LGPGDARRPRPRLAIHESFGTIVGEIAEVAVANNEVKVERVVAVVDAATSSTRAPSRCRSKAPVVYGLTAALYDRITIKDGRVEQGNFDEYPMVRLADSPKIETYMALSGGSKWGGHRASQGRRPIAPAVCNAILPRPASAYAACRSKAPI